VTLAAGASLVTAFRAGTYQPNRPVISIASFDPQLPIIMSKQRPRRLGINGSDHHVYQYLLKGHEDIRQDERVMQLFGLVNTLLAGEPSTGGDISIRQYPVIPLSQSSGLIGWVQGNDTLHQLVKAYRAERKLKVRAARRTRRSVGGEWARNHHRGRFRIARCAHFHTLAGRRPSPYRSTWALYLTSVLRGT